jgi:uncharacterized membrane protein
MDHVLERIAAWEAAGLIDTATAERLRAAEVAQPRNDPGDEQPADAAGPARRGPSSVAAIFGPGVTIGEMFAYLGGAFLLGAYETFVLRSVNFGERSFLPLTIGMAVAAIALTAFGVIVRNGDARRRRAAGVMFALAVAHVGAAVAAGAEGSGLGWPATGVIAAAVATVAAFGYRLFHPSLLTQLAILTSLTTFAGLALSWLESVVVPPPTYSDFGEPIRAGGPDPIALVVASAAWWLTLAVVLGLIGLREAASTEDDPAAGRRASLTRLWAGLVAVVGFATSVTRSGLLPYGEYGRIIEPWSGDLAIIILAGVLVERAFRRDASTFVYAAALGLMIALSDFNFTYLSSSTELGLLIEGIILLGAGVAADRLRRRIGQPGPEPEIVAPGTPA